MYSVYPLLVVATAGQQIQIFDLNRPTEAFKTTTSSPLKQQTRVITCFPDADGYAVGSIEERVGLQYLEEKAGRNNFSFKCHRKEPTTGNKNNPMVYAVNDISFHPYGTFSTAGSDGTINLWDNVDKVSNSRLRCK